MPPTPQESSGAPVAGRPGELLDRFLARLVDGILLIVVNVIVVSVVLVGALMGETANGFSGSSTAAAGIVAAVISTAIYLGYYGYLESSRGQTVGKMVMKLRTVGPDGGNPTMEQALKRNIFLAFGLAGIVPVIGGLVAALGQLIAVIMIAVGINGDPVRRQAWHDKFAGGTAVIKVG